MGIPILTSEGFAGQRLIIDDYFEAGETLYAGDVAVVRLHSNSARIFRPSSSHARRVIGIVHTPASKEVGDEVAREDDLVAIVTHGIAKAFSGENMSVGDPVAPSTTRATPSGKSSMSTVVKTDSDAPNTLGRCLSYMGAADTNEVVEILVDIAG